MLFNKTSLIQSQKNIDSIKSDLIGSTIELHDLKFEIIDNNSMLKIIPHAERDEKLRVLPITHVEFNSGQSGTKLILRSKPRRIDIGGPNLLLVFCFFTIVCGAWMYFFKGDEMRNAALLMMGIGLVIFLIFWIKMQQGYFDYVRKLKKFVKDKVGS